VTKVLSTEEAKRAIEGSGKDFGKSTDPSAMYIAIDPTQEIFGELPAAVNSES
jgi:hypothetical protein